MTGAEGILENWFKNRLEGPIVWKWLHYFDVYERHFARFRNASRINLLEFGVNAGGSIDLWKSYFGSGLHYYGVDINPDCKKFGSRDVTIIIGDQTSRKSLAQIRKQIPEMDIIIDDGGHSDLMQTNTLKEMFQKLHPSGVYLCEDLGSSFHSKSIQDNKGYSMLDMSKDLIDKSNAWITGLDHQKEIHGFMWNRKGLPPAYPGSSVKRWPIDDFTRSSGALHIYRGIVVVEKSLKANPIPNVTHTFATRKADNIDIYNTHLNKFRGSDRCVNLMEFWGTKNDYINGRIDFWRDFFGPCLYYYGVSMDSDFKAFEAQDVSIIIVDGGTSAIPEGLAQIRDLVPMLHVIIDYNSDNGFDQSRTFKEMFQMLRSDGVLLSHVFDGANLADQPQVSNRDPYSMFALAKKLVDKSQAWLFPVDKLSFEKSYVWEANGLPRAYRQTSVRQWPVDEFVRTANNVHVYRGIVVVEKSLRASEAPISVRAGMQNIICKSRSGCIGSSAKLKRVP